MEFDNELVAAKLRQWEKYIDDYRLPDWEEIPDEGLLMEHVLELISDYLDYLPPELKGERFITAATINNYVRKGVMPKPTRKRYHRIHLAYLIIICSLKQSLSIPTIQSLVPPDLDEDELRGFYERYRACHAKAAGYFAQEAGVIAAGVLHNGKDTDYSVSDTAELVSVSALISAFSRILAENLIHYRKNEG